MPDHFKISQSLSQVLRHVWQLKVVVFPVCYALFFLKLRVERVGGLACWCISVVCEYVRLSSITYLIEENFIANECCITNSLSSVVNGGRNASFDAQKLVE